jgi:hypothetical protein
MFEVKLIALYFYVCERYEEELKYCCQRFSNNHHPEFTDQEALTLYLYSVAEEKRLTVKDIYRFCEEHLHSWFPRLPSYQAFNTRLGRLSEALRLLWEELLEDHRPAGCTEGPSLVDALPIMTYRGAGHGKVAREVTTKGYCSTKHQYCYGLKLHALNWWRQGTLPHPEGGVLTGADENDLSVFKQHCSELDNRTYYGDKIYCNEPWFAQMYERTHSVMHTPVKAVKGMSEALRQWHHAADRLYSRAVSAMRQPIESWCHWLIEKTGIQTASKVRSTQGLLVHVFGKLAAAYIHLIFNP